MQGTMWIDYKAVRRYKMPFNFIIGGRGGGKTYGAVKMLDEMGEKGIWMRRTQTEMDLIMAGKESISLNPFKKYGEDTGKYFDVYKINKLVGVFGKGEHMEPDFDFMGYMVALSTVSSIRGFDANEIDDLIFDEFIPESHKHKMAGEAEAFLNAYETINRNREMSGRDALRAFLLSNSNQLAHPLLNYLGLDNVIQNMKRKKKQLHIDTERGILVYIPRQEAYVEKKRNTAIASLTSGTKFYEMAFENEFAYDDFTNIGGRSLRGYRPVCDIAGIGIWANDDAQNVYCCLAPTRKDEYKDTKADVIRFNMDIGRRLYGYYIENRLYFQNFSIKEKVIGIIG